RAPPTRLLDTRNVMHSWPPAFSACGQRRLRSALLFEALPCLLPLPFLADPPLLPEPPADLAPPDPAPLPDLLELPDFPDPFGFGCCLPDEVPDDFGAVEVREAPPPFAHEPPRALLEPCDGRDLPLPC